MSKFWTAVKVLGLLAAVILIGVLLGHLGTGGSKAPKPPPGAAPVAGDTGATAPTTSAGTIPSVAVPPKGSSDPRPRPPRANAAAPASPAAALPANVITNWEDKVDEILDLNVKEADKVKEMIAIFPRLPEDGQIEVAQHISNLAEDEDYAPVGAMLTNASLPEEVLDVLFSDALNRPNSIKLPLMLEVSRNEQNPKSGEARDILELFLEEDYGTDWGKWQAKLQEWLKENPD
jgi:hypothetical protein